MSDSELFRENGYLHVRGVFDHPPLLNDKGIEDHVNWGQDVMVAGRNPVYWERRPRFRLEPA
jgi:hypothetical protein